MLPPRVDTLNLRLFKKQHARTLKVSGVRPFVLYGLRHTFLTRLGERGLRRMDAC